MALALPGASVEKNSPANAGDMGSIPGSEDPLEKEMATHSNILAWKNPMDREAWRATVPGVARVRHDLVTKQQQRAIHIIYLLINKSDMKISYENYQKIFQRISL